VGLADNICGQNRRQFALLTGHWNFPALLQRIVEGLNSEAIKGKAEIRL
jgi:hypothetical protein